MPERDRAPLFVASVAHAIVNAPCDAGVPQRRIERDVRDDLIGAVDGKTRVRPNGQTALYVKVGLPGTNRYGQVHRSIVSVAVVAKVMSNTRTMGFLDRVLGRPARPTAANEQPDITGATVLPGRETLEVVGESHYHLFGDACGLRGAARGGNDSLFGGRGADRIYGAGGKDRLFGGRGDDVLYGGRGNDLLRGNTGRDQLRGGPGSDDLRASDGHRDKINCGPGRDRVAADDGDRLRGCEVIHRR